MSQEENREKADIAVCVKWRDGHPQSLFLQKNGKVMQVLLREIGGLRLHEEAIARREGVVMSQEDISGRSRDWDLVVESLKKFASAAEKVAEAIKEMKGLGRLSSELARDNLIREL